MPDIQEILEAQTWTFAKTMPRNPHYWSVGKDWDDEDGSLYEFAVNHIADYGVIEPFGRREYPVLYLGKWRYWHVAVDDPLSKARLINRGSVDA